LRSITSIKIKGGIRASVKNDEPEEVTSLKRGKKTSIRPREESPILDKRPPLSVEDRGVMKKVRSRTKDHPSW
jgi:hypothetical protein